MFLLAAALLIICMLQFTAILGLRQMLKDANSAIEKWKLDSDMCRNKCDRDREAIETITKQRDNHIEEMTRLTLALELCQLSLRNAENQFEEQVEANKRLQDSYYEYRSMLASIAAVLVDEKNLLDQVQSGTEWQDEQELGELESGEKLPPFKGPKQC